MTVPSTPPCIYLRSWVNWSDGTNEKKNQDCGDINDFHQRKGKCCFFHICFFKTSERTNSHVYLCFRCRGGQEQLVGPYRRNRLIARLVVNMFDLRGALDSRPYPTMLESFAKIINLVTIRNYLRCIPAKPMGLRGSCFRRTAPKSWDLVNNAFESFKGAKYITLYRYGGQFFLSHDKFPRQSWNLCARDRCA